ASGSSLPLIVTLEISTAWNTRSRNRRHAGLSASPNNERLQRRIKPADGNDTKMSGALIKVCLGKPGKCPDKAGHSYYILYFTSFARSFGKTKFLTVMA